jgi:hypothetical protein
MSLGAWDMPGVDPLEEAVNRVSAERGTLFVVAAGNNGPFPSIGSPGSADAALTVAAVDRNDIIAPFSSRGPRLGGGTIKPDVAAPGVGIVAAKSASASFPPPPPGEPGPEPGYQALSGTSMATPHVAGAAALLAQQHPDWTGDKIKAALLGSAKSSAKPNVFETGAGRVDVAKAIAATVTAAPSSLSFGDAPWPHDDDTPVTHTLTYANTGDKPVTLQAKVDATGADGSPAANGLFTVEPSTVTIPAGGQGTVTVTADTRVGSKDGLFQGAVVATGAGGDTVRTPIAVTREAEAYNVTVTYLDRDGNPNDRHSSDLSPLTGVGGFYPVPDSVDGKTTMRLARGEYMLWTRFYTNTSIGMVVNPSLMVDRDLSVIVDARDAKPIRITVPQDAAARENGGTFEIHRGAPDGSGPSFLMAFPGGFSAEREVLVGQARRTPPRPASSSVSTTSGSAATPPIRRCTRWAGTSPTCPAGSRAR